MAKKQTSKPVAATSKKRRPVTGTVRRAVQKITTPVTTRTKSLMNRRPHRSFRMTNRRDYKRSLKAPGYWGFTNYVRKTLWSNKKLFGGLVLTYIAAAIIIGGLGAQETYATLSETLKQSGGELFEGNLGAVGQAGLLLVSSVTTGLSPDLTEAQSVLGGLAVFFAWLTAVWLLRNTLAGHKPKLRDGLYNSGSPVLATILVGFIITVQLLPAAIGVIVYSAAQVSGLMETGVIAMLVWLGVALLSVLSLYWITSSLLALVIVTLPGMYPLHAIRTAGDLAVGRRIRILLRLLWLALTVVVAWALVMIPLILFDDWIKSVVPAINWLPLVPITIIAMASLTIVFSASYVYLFYRKIVDDDAAPA